MHEKLETLKARLREIDDLRSAAALLHWDQATYMPPDGAAARGRQLATLNRLAHEKFIRDEIGALLDDLRPLESDAESTVEAALVRVTRRDYEKAVKVPAEFEARVSDHLAASYQLWTVARENDDFEAVRPCLEKTLDLSREMAKFCPGYEHIADPLIDLADEGMTAATLKVLFADLRRELVPLVDAITAQPRADDACLRRHFPESQQLAFAEKIIRRFGYDFARGRQDKTHHPFMTKFSLGDVRITTRCDENNLAEALFSTLHEAGHALYEQGIDRDFEATPLAEGASAGVHESQSRLWENLVGRSRGFWKYFYPRLQQQFSSQLDDVSPDKFYRAINKVERSLIRTDADEVTYNLHVLIRFDFELELLEGKLAVRDLPDAWRERYRRDLGVAPPNDRDGVLQDVHWFGGLIGGAFQGYTIGNILSAQFFEAAVRAHPAIPAEIEDGRFETLHGWLRENVYRHGRTFAPLDLLERATGQTLDIAPYGKYLRDKFGALYAV